MSPAAVSKKHLKEFMRPPDKELLRDKVNRAQKNPYVYNTIRIANKKTCPATQRNVIVTDCSPIVAKSP